MPKNTRTSLSKGEKERKEFSLRALPVPKHEYLTWLSVLWWAFASTLFSLLLYTLDPKCRRWNPTRKRDFIYIWIYIFPDDDDGKRKKIEKNKYIYLRKKLHLSGLVGDERCTQRSTSSIAERWYSICWRELSCVPFAWLEKRGGTGNFLFCFQILFHPKRVHALTKTHTHSRSSALGPKSL